MSVYVFGFLKILFIQIYFVGITDEVSRAQLINDAVKLAHSGYLKYSTALSVSSYLQYELEYIPWMAGFNVFGYLNDMLRRTGSYDKFKVSYYKDLFTEN